MPLPPARILYAFYGLIQLDFLMLCFELDLFIRMNGMYSNIFPEYALRLQNNTLGKVNNNYVIDQNESTNFTCAFRSDYTIL